MERNTIFISYPSDDSIIAESVANAIDKLPNKGIRYFLDRVAIKGGAIIPDEIKVALRTTFYFVAIGTNVTRRAFDWCGQELGFYQACHDDKDRLETCLYDKVRPELFEQRKSYKAQSLVESHAEEFDYPLVDARQSEFYEFLLEVAEKNAKLHPPEDPAKYYKDAEIWAEVHASAITNAFL